MGVNVYRYDEDVLLVLDDVWDRDYDDAGDPTQLHAQVLVRRVRYWGLHRSHQPPRAECPC